jgi:glycosyltransferase involved in cell wall biosynthesis
MTSASQPADSRPRRDPAVVALVTVSPGTTGGQAVQAAALRDALRSEGMVLRHVPTNPPLPPGLRWLRDVRFVRTLVNEVVYALRLRELRGADIAVLFSAANWSFLLAPAPAILAARALGCKVVLAYHSGEAEEHLSRFGRIVKPLLRRVDHLVVQSEFLRGIFERHGLSARVVPNVIDLDAFAFKPPSGGARLVSARSLEPHYGVDDTLRAFALIREAYPQATLTILGTGGQEVELRRLTMRLGVGGVRFLGAVHARAMPRVLADCDIFVNSSWIDNQPVSILEAFAAGLPVVTTPPGGIPELVRNESTGLLVPHGDPHAMAKAVSRLLDSPALAVSLAERARQEVERFSWSQVRGAWLDMCTGEKA